MRKDFGPKSWLYPMPVLVIAAYDEQGRPNAMNAAWGGIFTDDTIGICLSKGHRQDHSEHPAHQGLHGKYGNG